MTANVSDGFAEREMERPMTTWLARWADRSVVDWTHAARRFLTVAQIRAGTNMRMELFQARVKQSSEFAYAYALACAKAGATTTDIIGERHGSG